MLKIVKLPVLMLVGGLVACGGGGGSSGSSNLPYSISVRAEKTQLPINIGNSPAGIGAYASYTTTIYVEAREGGAPIPGGDDIFACNLAGGLDSGALYYLDGDEDHEDDDGNPLAYRSVTLGSNSGGASFHFHAINKAGTARITCSVTNPSDNLVSSASVDIVVGAATGKPANVIATTMAPFALGSRLNTSLVPDNVGIQAFIRDDANQPIPNPSGGANLQVSIRPFGAYVGSRLLSGSQSGNVLQVRTISGVGQVSLSSGMDTGAILLEYVADRFDNDVSNGVQDPIVSLHAVSVNNTIGSGDPLVISGSDTISVTAGNSFAYAFSIEGGVGPFTWSAIGGLPAGLTLSASGVISGITSAAAGDYAVVLRVVDGAGSVAIKNLKITVTAAPTTPTTPTTPTIGPLVFTANGCSSAVGTACPLPAAVSTGSYAYAFSASGGDTTKPVTWIFSGVPGWLTSATAGNNGVVNGTPPAGAACFNFLVTATRDTLSVTRQVSIAVDGGVCP
ncbi:MAG: Ig domain-containing protein [Gammaproteobacteria bacterium]|jgi:hypothetical protein|nr:Ig domain-containing protein [Gammaproteobacteria bacterium]MBU1507716.1 Ig domain-containing protein [Gammaproteobacteria bacterium]MBU2120446.1 Ig domain-containing protein [Gammaproteobacteria bacterium]MBU2171334.1 Ig domain-containing protein [Gammaproteobacteria bacterium]MBU2199270.1 Ig domain-containing protein [Gammaproteobacteria bacterium]